MMRMSGASGLLVAIGSGAIAAGAVTMASGLGDGIQGAAGVRVVTAPASMPGGAATAASTTPDASASADTAPGEATRPTNLPLSDIVYFGAGWTSLELNGPNPAFVLADGYRNPEVVRDPLDNTFIAGTVEKADASGRVTDVILTFTGSATPSRDDVTDVGLLLGTGDPQTRLAERLFDRLMTDSRYASARIHVTGHSMGSALATWLFAHSMATYGKAQTYARVSAILFAAPPWGNGALTRFGLTEADFYNRVQNYATANDVIMAAGLINLGVQHRLVPYEPLGVAGRSLGPVNYGIGHHPIAVLLGLGLPAWLSPAQKTAVLTSIGVTPTLDAWQRDYGAQGTVAKTVTGDAGADWIEGSDAGDVITAAAGADVLTGGRGADRFVYRAGDSTAAAPDRIVDFNPDEGDRLDFSQIDAVGGNLTFDRFRFVGSSPSGSAGEISFSWDGTDTIVVATVGGQVPAVIVRLAGRINLLASHIMA